MKFVAKAQDSKWKLEGRDGFDPDAENYSLDGEYDTREEAEIGALKRLKELERSQPGVESGGQHEDGIQDHVYLVSPDGGRIRFYD